MALAPFALLASIKTDFRGLGGRREALTLHTAGRGLGLPPLAAALALAQGFHQLGPHPDLAPGLEVGINGIPLAKLPRHHPPLTARLEQIEDPIEHLAQVTRRTPRATWTPFPRWKQRPEQCPLRLG